MMGPLTSCMALYVASLGVRPLAMFLSTFSTTTMASSTTIPMANTIPKSDRALIEKPKASNSAKVPMMDTGTAIKGMIAVRHD